jgi:hypothetical protein
VNNRAYSLLETYNYPQDSFVDLEASNNESTVFSREFDSIVLKNFNERIEELKKKFNRTSPHVDEWD